MTYTREQVIAAMHVAFSDHDSSQILARLDTYGIEPYERERERVQLAIIALSERNEQKLEYFLAVAKKDYRDVLFWADHPEESKLDTPEKRQRFSKLLKKLGIKPPANLDE